MASSERFGYEWQKYPALTPDYEEQFRAWISPLGQEDFVGKSFLDAGCGMGRNSYWPLEWGAAKAVAFDFDRRSVDAASRNLSAFPQAQVMFKSIYDISWSSEFDVAFSIGV